MKSLNPQQELFCKYYVQEGETFGNATLAYAEAYGYDLDGLERDEKEKAKNACAVAGSKLLRNAKVLELIRKLLNEKLNEGTVDAELSKLVLQDGDMTAKLGAIKEYNRVRGRVTARHSVDMGVSRPLQHLSDAELIALIT